MRNKLRFLRNVTFKIKIIKHIIVMKPNMNLNKKVLCL
jgi:hypothetical protein